MDLRIITFSLKFPFIAFGVVGGILFYVFALYMVAGILVFNKTMIELITFGLIKTKSEKVQGG